MSDSENILAEAIRRHQAGELAEAERLYHQVLVLDHRHAEAIHLLGLIVYQAGRIGEAEELIGKAIAIKNDAAVFYSNLGTVLKGSGQLDRSLLAYRAALCLLPGFIDAYYNMGTALKDLGRGDDAMAAYGKALHIRPDYAEALSNQGNILHGMDRPYDAVANYRAALCLKPDFLDATGNLGAILNELGRHQEAAIVLANALKIQPDFAEGHSNLGTTLRELGCMEDAIDAYRLAVRIKPDYAHGYSNLGIGLQSKGLLHEAIAAFKMAVCVWPGFANAYYNIGVSFADLGSFDSSMLAYFEALKIQPDYVVAQTNLACVHFALGHLPETMAGLKTALVLDPCCAEAHTNLGNALLLNGQFEKGWREYDWRWGIKALKRVTREFDMPQWRGEPLNGRTILLHAEQGMGDAIQFSRFAPMVNERGGRVVIEAHRPIIRLLSGLTGVERMVARGDPLPPCDLHCPLMSLPRAFATTLSTIPAPIPYLTAEPERVAKWRERLGATGFRIGIVWQGSPVYKSDMSRSIPLATFLALAKIPGVRLISLQKQHGLEQLDALPSGMVVETLGADFDEGPDGFLDTAAVMMNLDLIVTADTAAGHIAGALGCPVWLALSVAPHWPWMLGRADTPWYPNTRLFRQTSRGDWGSVIEDMAGHLRPVVAGRAETWGG